MSVQDYRSGLVLVEPVFAPGRVLWHGMAFAGGEVVNDITGVDRAGVLDDCWCALDEAGISTEPLSLEELEARDREGSAQRRPPASELVVITEVDRMNKAAKRRSSKAQNLARHILKVKAAELEKQVGALLACLRALDAELDPDWLTQWRQAGRRRHPRIKPAQSSLPENMTCRKCKRVFDDPTVFFMDDGQGEYGYTGRCVDCRRGVAV